MLALTLGVVSYQFSHPHFTRGSIATSSSPTPAALRRRSSTLTTMVATSSPPLDAASEEGWGRLDAQSDEGYDEFDAWATSEKLERAKATYAPEHAPERHHEEWTITTEGAVHDHFFSNRAASFDALPGASQRLADNCAALGFTRPSRAQADAFGPIVEGDDCVLAHPTGAGKSLAYVAPLVQRLWDLEAEHGRTPKRQVRAIVIVPTEELGAQVSGARAHLGRAILGRAILGRTSRHAVTDAPSFLSSRCSTSRGRWRSGRSSRRSPPAATTGRPNGGNSRAASTSSCVPWDGSSPTCRHAAASPPSSSTARAS